MQRLILFISLFYVGLTGFNALLFAQETAIVNVAVVEQKSIPKYYYAPGYTAALNNIEISSKQSGFITKILVEAGETVEKGQLLLIIDETVNKQSIEQVKKEVEIARITVTDAKKDVANFERLRKGQSVSEEKLRKARLLLAHSQSTLLKAKAKLIETQSSRPYLRLISPENARVVKRMVGIGDLAMAGKALIHLEVLKPILFETSVPVQWVKKLNNKQLIVIKFNLEHKSDEVIGRITQIITLADPSTQQCIIKLQLPDSLNIPTGLFGQAQFSLKEELVLIVPVQAVVTRVGITGVFRIDKGNRVVFTPVKIGRKYAQQQIILSGLNLNEQVVLSPSDNLQDGMNASYDN